MSRHCLPFHYFIVIIIIIMARLSVRFSDRMNETLLVVGTGAWLNGDSDAVAGRHHSDGPFSDRIGESARKQNADVVTLVRKS